MDILFGVFSGMVIFGSGALFWILSSMMIITCALIIEFSDFNRNNAWPFWMTVIFFGVIGFLNFGAVKTLATISIGQWAMITIAYVIIGVIIGSLKYVLTLKKCKRKFENEIAEYPNHSTDGVKRRAEKLHPSYMKSRITNWMIWWPCTLITFILTDIVKETFAMCYDRLSNFFIVLYNRIIGDFLKSLEITPKE